MFVVVRFQVRLGGDSQQTFGHCSLCIHPAVEPMATPSGHVYCKECIVEFLLAKTQELRRQREAFEAQEKSQGGLTLMLTVTVTVLGSRRTG